MAAVEPHNFMVIIVGLISNMCVKCAYGSVALHVMLDLLGGWREEKM
jgi:hypothetical protein